MKFRLAALMSVLPGMALAHTGHQPGTFASGIGHPLSGADHILAMISIGLLAAQMGGHARFALPTAFVGAMVFGGLLGAAGVPFVAVEPMILASIVVLGALVAMSINTGLSVAVPMAVPARMIVYFSACEDPWAYTGRLFWAEREMEAMGIELDPQDAHQFHPPARPSRAL